MCRGFSDAIEGGPSSLDLVMMSSTVLVHTKGYGPSFQCDAHTSIPASSSRVELKLALVNAQPGGLAVPAPRGFVTLGQVDNSLTMILRLN